MDCNCDRELGETTEGDFIIFKAECEKWIEYFGLFGWEVSYAHKEFDHKQHMADICYNIFSRDAVIRLNLKRPESECTEKSVRRSAFHEVCELLLGRLTHMAEARFLTEGEVEEETHNIIRILENKIFKGK